MVRDGGPDWCGSVADWPRPALAEWLIWVPLTPVIMRLARRYPIAWPPAAKSLVVHAPGIGAAACLRGTVYAGATYLVVGGPVRIPFGSYLWRVSLAWLPIGALVWGAIIAAGAALDYARRSGNERSVMRS